MSAAKVVAKIALSAGAFIRGAEAMERAHKTPAEPPQTCKPLPTEGSREQFENRPQAVAKSSQQKIDLGLDVRQWIKAQTLHGKTNTELFRRVGRLVEGKKYEDAAKTIRKAQLLKEARDLRRELIGLGVWQRYNHFSSRFKDLLEEELRIAVEKMKNIKEQAIEEKATKEEHRKSEELRKAAERQKIEAQKKRSREEDRLLRQKAREERRAKAKKEKQNRLREDHENGKHKNFYGNIRMCKWCEAEDKLRLDSLLARLEDEEAELRNELCVAEGSTYQKANWLQEHLILKGWKKDAKSKWDGIVRDAKQIKKMSSKQNDFAEFLEDQNWMLRQGFGDWDTDMFNCIKIEDICTNDQIFLLDGIAKELKNKLEKN